MKGLSFGVRYDLVRTSDAKGGPVYNCVYLRGDTEHVLVSTNPKDGLVRARELGLFPPILKTHHKGFGDGTVVIFEGDTEIVSTWRYVGEDALERVSIGLDVSDAHR